MVYKKFFENLKRRSGLKGADALRCANVVLIYLERSDGSSDKLMEKFGTEALVLPIGGVNIETVELHTSNQRNNVLNDLVERGKRTIERSQKLLSAIAEEVTNRDNRTCLLLPPKNFGKGMGRVSHCVHGAALDGVEVEEFKKRVKAVESTLPKQKKGNRRFFVGAKGLIFESPTKAGPRHGQVPDWGSKYHDASCIVRGKIRFGISYDQNFHYDCDLPKGVERSFPSCHGVKKLERGKGHANIAPNDNVR
ncbi:MAG: hypothetical protein OXF88_04890 [Rhodobacteraceae bacterium]|nr:hypothetical protein [Paracoccaceae bacterium]